VAAVTLGAEAAVFVAAYDMLTQPRIALGSEAAQNPIEQSKRSALADYAPTAGAVAGVLLGRAIEAPPTLATIVTALGIAMSILGAILLGAAWPREWYGRCATQISLRGLALSIASALALLPVAVAVGG
jgi:hypothetical protein